MNNSLIIGIGIGAASVLVIWYLNRTYGFRRMLGVAGLFLLLGLFIFGSYQQPFPTMVAVFALAIIYVLVHTFSTIQLRRLESYWEQVWNPGSIYTGSVLGDIGSTLAIVGGLGVSNYIQEPFWWWLGQNSALLSLCVGFILLWRYFRSDWELTVERSAMRLNALIYVLIGLAVWLALTFAPSSHRSLAVQDQFRWLWFGVGVGILLLQISIFFFYRPGPGRRDLFILIGTWAVAIILAAVAGVFAFQRELILNFDQTERVAVIAGLAGIAIWIFNEAYHFISLTLQWQLDGVRRFSAVEYLILEKNLGQIISGVATFIFLSAVLSDVINGRAIIAGLQNGDTVRNIFVIGATIGLLGTVRGLVSGILNR